MAFEYTITKVLSVGDIQLVTGTYTNGGSDTGGAIATGLSEIFFFDSNCEKSQADTVNKVAISYGTATITTVADEDGKWEAWGV